MTLPLPYGSTPSVTGPNNPQITLVGLRQYSSPLCQPTTGVGCPPDGIPVFSNIFAEDTIANSNYNSFQVSLEKHFSKGLLFSLAYTLSKSIDNASSFEAQLNPGNYGLSRSLSLFDARNRIVFSPYWRFSRCQIEGFRGKLLDGWAMSGIITYQSGFPIRLYDANDTELASSFFFEPAGEPTIVGPVRILNPKTNGGQYLIRAHLRIQRRILRFPWVSTETRPTLCAAGRGSPDGCVFSERHAHQRQAEDRIPW